MNVTWANRWFRAYAGIKRVDIVQGYNSNLPDNRHFLMWDFDEVPLWEVSHELARIQRKYKLPRIWLLPTGRQDCFHANCFKSLLWHECYNIIADTFFVDKKFLSIGIMRGFFTLRYSPVGGREIEQAIILPSKVEEDVNPFELVSFVSYPKARRG